MKASPLILGNNPAALAAQEIASPVGALSLMASDIGLCGLRPSAFQPPLALSTANVSAVQLQRATAFLAQAAAELSEYFAGTRREFSVPLAPQGTAFQQQIWQQLLALPFGATVTYGELAKRIGNLKAARAVGAANGANKIAIIIPCHRVIGQQGKLTGYAWGLAMKQQLLTIEQV